jgi:hypothetical protein
MAVAPATSRPWGSRGGRSPQAVTVVAAEALLDESAEAALELALVEAERGRP